MKGRYNAMKNNEKKAIATVNSAFAALKDFNLSDALSEELSGLSGSFERIKIPGDFRGQVRALVFRYTKGVVPLRL